MGEQRTGHKPNALGAAVPQRELAPQRQVVAPKVDAAPVVRGEDNDRVRVHPLQFQCLDQCADRAVECEHITAELCTDAAVRGALID